MTFTQWRRQLGALHLYSALTKYVNASIIFLPRLLLVAVLPDVLGRVPVQELQEHGGTRPTGRAPAPGGRGDPPAAPGRVRAAHAQRR